ncbi:MAG: hypothetical protein P8X90_29220 [Desulfobacterales bacterium]|jgi:hypothetical protein
MKIPLIGINVSAGTLALGAIGILLAPKVVPAAANLLRSATKTGIKGGMIAYDKGREFVAGTVDTFHDIASEARSEVSKDSRKAAPKKKAATTA